MEILTLGAVILAIGMVLAGTLWSKVPPMPTSPRVAKEMLARAAVLEPTPRHIYELGAGWGGLAMAFAKAFPDARVVAVELAPLPWAVTRLRAAFGGPENLEVCWGNALRTDLTDADLVVCFLFPEVMAPLAEKLRRDLPPGSHVISNTFALPGWEPLTDGRVADVHRSVVYLYRQE